MKNYKIHRNILLFIMLSCILISAYSKVFLPPVKYHYIEKVGFVGDEEYQKLKQDTIEPDPEPMVEDIDSEISDQFIKDIEDAIEANPREFRQAPDPNGIICESSGCFS